MTSGYVPCWKGVGIDPEKFGLEQNFFNGICFQLIKFYFKPRVKKLLMKALTEKRLPDYENAL